MHSWTPGDDASEGHGDGCCILLFSWVVKGVCEVPNSINSHLPWIVRAIDDSSVLLDSREHVILSLL